MKRYCPVTLSIACLLIPGAATPAGNIIRVPADVTTIAEALAAIAEGGIIQVAEGTHAGGFTITQSVTIQGGFPPDFSGDPDPQIHPTIITGSAGVNAVNAVLGTGDAVFVNGVICMDGLAGIDATLTDDSLLSLDTVTILGNQRGIRVDAHDTAALSGNLVFVSDNAFVGAGGGLMALADDQAAVTLSACQFAGNSATEGGGAAAVEASVEAAVSFIGTTFTGNGYLASVSAPGPGTILYTVVDAAAFFLDGSTVEGNVPATPGDAAVAGTQDAGASLVQIIDSTFRASEAGVGGEAIDAHAAGVAAVRLVTNSFEGATSLVGPIVNIVLDEQAVAFVLRNRFVGNTSAMHLVTTEQLASTFLNFDGNVLRGNTTPEEVIALSVSPLATGVLMRAINNQVSENVADVGSGGGRFTVNGPNVGQVGYNTFVNNIAASGVAGIHLLAPDFGPAQASNNVAIGNLAGGVPADLVVEGFLANAIGNFLTGDGNPGFTDIDAGDFTLVKGSVLIDAADAGAFQIDHDFEEDPRPVAGASDVGSDEFLRHGDFDLDGDVDIDDFNQFVICFTGPDGGPINAGCEPGDADDDDDIDCDDWAAFLLAWTSPDPPPDFPECPGVAIPTATEWGLIVMILLLAAAGTMVFQKRKPSVAT